MQLRGTLVRESELRIWGDGIYGDYGCMEEWLLGFGSAGGSTLSLISMTLSFFYSSPQHELQLKKDLFSEGLSLMFSGIIVILTPQ